MEKSKQVIFTHNFVDLSGNTETTKVDLSRVESIDYTQNKTKARLTLSGRDKQVEIYCTPDSLDSLVAEWEKVRGFIVRMV